MKLEELQEYADACETVEHYQKRFAIRVLVLISKAMGWMLVGFMIMAGSMLAKWVFS